MKLPDARLILRMCATICVLPAATPSTLAIKQCEVLEYTSISCYWETTSHTANSSYKLQVNKTVCESKESFISVGSCDTVGFCCSIQPIDSAFHCFGADVVSYTSSGSVRSEPFYFRGVNNVRLHPPNITHSWPSAEKSDCMEIGWKMQYILPESEKPYRRLQIEHTTHDQTRWQTVQPFSRDRVELCDLFSGSRYTVKMRMQDSRAPNHWSSWTSTDFMTVEKAPSAAPGLWRIIRPPEETRRHLTLFWKTLSWPEANGVVRSYVARCRSDVGSGEWSCGDLDPFRTSCDLLISVEACSCSLTAANSAGTSPVSYIYIPAHTDAELPPPKNISVVSLDDTRLKVEWTTAQNQSESGFVVQWISVLHNGTTNLYWEHLNETSRSFVLTGLLPEVPYNVSVISLYGKRAGTDMSLTAFTREGAPSAGPQLTGLQNYDTGLVIRWDPVPIQKLRGFLKGYTVLYSINGKDERAPVGGAVERVTLTGLMEGIYNICVMVHTAAGGAAGPWQMVAVGQNDTQVTPILLCALFLISFILITSVCMRLRVKQCLCPTVPDPSKSSLSAWSICKPGQQQRFHSSLLSSGRSTSFHGYGEKDYSPVQVLGCHDNEDKPNTYGPSSEKTYTPVCQPRTGEPAQRFQGDFINRSYIKPDQTGYQDDYLSVSDPLLETVLTYQSHPVAPGLLLTEDTYRTLDSDGRVSQDSAETLST